MEEPPIIPIAHFFLRQITKTKRSLLFNTYCKLVDQVFAMATAAKAQHSKFDAQVSSANLRLWIC